MKNLYYFFIAAIMAISVLSCNEDESPSGETVDNPGTIADFISSNSDYSLLQSAIERTGLEIFLDGTNPHTFFAPNNSALQAFLDKNELDDIDRIPLDTLTSILSNHILAGEITASQLPDYQNSLQEFIDFKLSVFTNASGLVNGNARITNGDISVSNGTIHAVDSILPLPTMLSHVIANDRFSMFEEALVAASVGNGNFLNRLDVQYPEGYTLFVPNNSAFQTLLDNIGVNSISEIDIVSLRTIINYHLYPNDYVRSGDVTNGLSLTSLQGEEIVFAISNGLQVVDAIGESATILTPNIQGVNGVVHELDKVLFSQESYNIVVPTLMQEIRVNSSLSLLEEALDLSGLNVLLEDRDADLTIMAPANFAFTAFLDGEDIDDMPVDVLTQLVKNHVLDGRRYVADFTTGYLETAATYPNTSIPLNLYVNTDNDLLFNGNIEIIEGDIETANGNLQMLNRVIGIPTVLTFIAADPDLDLLQSGLTTRTDVPDYNEILTNPVGSGIAPFTIFAPTDEAFMDLFTELNIFGLGSLDGPTLTSVLNNHIVSETSIRSNDLVSGPLTTLGEVVTVNAANATLTDPNSRTANITQVDIQAGNGVVHKIDKVLLAN